MKTYLPMFGFLTLALGLTAGNAELPATPIIFPVRENETLVHVIAAPFGEAGYEPRLEALLLANNASRGFKYRRVNNYLSQVLASLEATVLVHQPTIVLLQTGNRDLVRHRHFEFLGYPVELEKIAAELVRRDIRVIVCSPVPVGNGSRPDRLLPPMDGLSKWVTSARDIAAKYRATYVDLFTEAIEWPMTGKRNGPYFYSAPQHRASFELFSRQLQFQPSNRLNISDLEKSPLLQAQKAAFKAELDRGAKLSASLSAIVEFRLPRWVKVDDFTAQQEMAKEKLRRELDQYDRELARMAIPSP